MRRAPTKCEPQYPLKIGCVMTPCVVAETASVALTAMPSCDAPPPAVSKKTRSPAWICELATGEPTPYCAKLERGSEMPAWANDHWTRPEQSNALGPVAP